ncbi:hypothetical protein ACQKWADRAFT_331709 [Trichoderma austrokoningii]
MTAAGVRKEIAGITNMSLARITEAKEVRSGWSLRMNNEEAMKYLLAPHPAYERHMLRVEREEEWHAYFVTRVPATFRDLTGERPIGPMVAAEAQAKAKAKEPPKICKPAVNDAGKTTQDWIIVFREKVKEGFRIFGTSGPAREMLSAPTPQQCNGCFGWHRQGVCSRQEICKRCSKPEHGNCDDFPQCINCLGPHEADSSLCKARPTTEKGEVKRPTKTQLRGIKKLGLASFEAAHPKGKRKQAGGEDKAPTTERAASTTANPSPGGAPKPHAEEPPSTMVTEREAQQEEDHNMNL